MDGFRDRMNRTASDRGSMDRGGYDRYDRGSRRSSYGAAPSGGISIDDVMQAVDESNGKQLDVLSDLFEDAKDDRFESEKQILAALDDVIGAVSNVADSQKVTEEQVAKLAADFAAKKELEEYSEPEPEETYTEEKPDLSEEILKGVNSNADLLAQFAEEQLPMLVRGNSSMLNQIRVNLEEKDDMLKEILARASAQPQHIETVNNNASDNEEVLAAAANNAALLNALRSEVAGVQAEIRRQGERMAADDGTPLDSEDAFTKAQAEEMYKNMEESVHGECVKVYRNVQKVIEEQNASTQAAIQAGTGGLKGLAFVNLVLLLLNLAAVLLRIFNII